MKVADIKFTGLTGGTVEGGWAEELTPEDNIHTVVEVVTDAGLGIGRRMKLTISCDHRVMDGAMGARFLQDVKRLLEQPLRLLV